MRAWHGQARVHLGAEASRAREAQKISQHLLTLNVLKLTALLNLSLGFLRGEVLLRRDPHLGLQVLLLLAWARR